MGKLLSSPHAPFMQIKSNRAGPVNQIGWYLTCVLLSTMQRLLRSSQNAEAAPRVDRVLSSGLTT